MPGLSFDAATRILSGTPTANGATELTYTATDGTEERIASFSVIVRDAGQNQRPQIAEAFESVRGEPNTFVEVDLSAYFMDPDGDPLIYTSVSEAPTRVRVVRQDGPMLTLYFGFRLSGSTTVTVTATDVFDAFVLQRLFTRTDRAPVLINQFVDVTLDVADGPQTYEEAGGNLLSSHFSDSSSAPGEPTVAFRFEASSEDETIASVSLDNLDSLGNIRLTPNTPLTLTPAGCLGDTVVSVRATDRDGGSSEGRFTVTVEDPSGVAPECGVGGVLGDVNRAILPEVARAIAGHIVDAIARRIEQARDGVAAAGTIGGRTSLASALAAHGEAVSEGTRNFEDLLGDSNFVLPLGAGDEDEAGTPSVTLWGGGDYRNLSGESGEIKWDGDLLSVHLGGDVRLREDVLAGLMVSRSRSDLKYEAGTTQKGDHELSVTNVSPYVGWSALDGGMDLWASVGYGTGDLEVSYGPDGTDGKALSDVEMRTVSAGVSGRVMELEAGGAIRIKGDALKTTLEVDDSSDGAIEKESFDASRLRVSVEASLSRAMDSGAKLEPSVEAGVRHDGGDGNTGSGIELNVGLRHTQPTSGVTLEGGAYTLVGRDDYQEWGIHGQLQVAAGTAGRGLSLNLSPGYGNTPSGLQKIWQQDVIEQDANSRDAGMRVDTRLGYGLSTLGGQGLLTPYSEITFEKTNSYRLGLKWDAGSVLRLNLVGEHRGSPVTHEVLLKVEVLF